MKDNVCREIGPDIFRVLCCIGVINYHVMFYIMDTNIGKVVYWMSSFCVLGFFLLSGYLLSQKEELTILYIEKKIIGTVKYILCWNLLWYFVNCIVYNNVPYDFWNNLFCGFFSGGSVPITWFLFSYCIVLVFAYFFVKFQRLYPSYFVIFVVLYVSSLNLEIWDIIISRFTQSLWLHLYIGYFLVGMIMRLIMNICGGGNACLPIAGIVFVISSIYYYYVVSKSLPEFSPAQAYGKWYYTVWIVSLFYIVLKIKVKTEWMKKGIQSLAKNTLVVYLGHVPIIWSWTVHYSISDPIKSFTMVFLLFVSLEMCSQLFRKMPLFRHLT